MINKNLDNHDNWETPKEFYDIINAEFNFDFDPCPLNDGEITPDKDGLLIPWGERNYINPPYSQDLKAAFVDRAIEMSKSGKVCVMLLPVSTSSELFHDDIFPHASEIRWIKPRIKFKGLGVDGTLRTKTNGTHDSMLVVFDPYSIKRIGGSIGGSPQFSLMEWKKAKRRRKKNK